MGGLGAGLVCFVGRETSAGVPGLVGGMAALGGETSTVGVARCKGWDGMMEGEREGEWVTGRFFDSGVMGRRLVVRRGWRLAVPAGWLGGSGSGSGL